MPPTPTRPRPLPAAGLAALGWIACAPSSGPVTAPDPGTKAILEGFSHPGHPRLTARLRGLLQTQGARPGHRPAGLSWDGSRVLVNLTLDPDTQPEVLARLPAMGATLRRQIPGRALVSTPPAALETLADTPGVWRIAGHDPGVPTSGTAVTEGAALSRVAGLHGAGFDGEGFTIAVIDHFNGGSIPTLQASGDLPPDDRLRLFPSGDFDQPSYSTLHGESVAEIIYDHAPGAELMLFNTRSSSLTWEEALDQAVAEGADIINVSMGRNGWETPGDGRPYPGSLQEQVAAARAAEVLYVGSGGNTRLKHWRGTLSTTTPGEYHDFGTTPEPSGGPTVMPLGRADETGYWCQPLGEDIWAALRWSDWRGVDQDLDLELLMYDSESSTWSVVDASDDPQDGSAGQQPTEYITYTVDDSSPVHTGCSSGTLAALRVLNYDATHAVDIDLMGSDEIRNPVHAGSTRQPADALAALAVGAVNSGATEPTGTPEDYSSEGPLLAAGGWLPDGDGALKPDLASWAKVTTQSKGDAGFGGTSSAAPHAAGMAALLWQLEHTFDVDTLEAEILYYASLPEGDLGDPGPDTTFGHGVLILPPGAPPEADAGGPYAVGELEHAPLDATESSGPVDLVQFEWDCDGDGTFDWTTDDPEDGEGCRWAHEGTFPIRLRVTDDAGWRRTALTSVTVSNAAPALSELDGDTSLRPGEAGHWSVTAEDSPDDTLSYTWDPGDGTPATTGAELDTHTHAYANPGRYTLVLTVDDNDGGVSEVSAVVSVTAEADDGPAPTDSATPDSGAPDDRRADAKDSGGCSASPASGAGVLWCLVALARRRRPAPRPEDG